MRKLVIVITFIMLAGCATIYQRESFTGGYSETQLREDIFRVSFRGNARTSHERAFDFSLLRSAELALERGFRYFVIIDSEKYSKTGTITPSTTSHTTASAYGSGNYAHGSSTTITSGGPTFHISKPIVTNMVLCFKEKPQTDGLFFDAEFIVNSIKQKYGIK